jgi:hypothetical protein
MNNTKLKSNIVKIFDTLIDKNQFRKGQHYDVNEEINIYTNDKVDYIVVSLRENKKEIIEISQSTYSEIKETKIEIVLDLLDFERINKTITKFKNKVYKIAKKSVTDFNKTRIETLKTSMKEMRKEIKQLSNIK